jgi:hypothetical protein
VRKPAEPTPVPFLTFECPEDVRGQHLIWTLPDPTDLRSLTVQCAAAPEARRSANGQAATAARSDGAWDVRAGNEPCPEQHP